MEVSDMRSQLTEATDSQMVDVLIVGGGAAGLSAALVLARSRRRVVVIDAGQPRNAPAAHMHGYLSRDGTPPLELLAAGRAEVEGYGGEIVAGLAERAEQVPGCFAVTLADGTVLHGRRLLVTTGLVDELPDIPGLREQWGRHVLHCPYCHGWEVRDRPVGILAGGPKSIHQALLFRQLTADVVYFTHQSPPLTDEQAEELAALDIRVVPGTVESLEIDDDRLVGVRLQDGTVVAREALAVAPSFVARSKVLASLGITPSVLPFGFGERIEADANGQTAVPGVWVAGNVTDLSAQVIVAAAGGMRAATVINADLAAGDTRVAVAAYRAQAAIAPAFATGRAS
jgi:thioredoxin reductase